MLTAGQVGQYMRHTLGGDIPPSLDVTALINQAGEHLMSMRAWKFLERPQADLDLRGKITLTGATYYDNQAGTPPASVTNYTIESTGAFANYTFLDGDQIAITGGANATEGLYKVASRFNDDEIVLKSSIGSAADEDMDIAGTMELDSVALPADFAEVIGYNATDSLINSLEFVTLGELLKFKTQQIQVTSFNFYGAIIWPEMNTAGPTVPFPILKIWPTPTTNDARGLTIFYRAGWVKITDDSDIVQIPPWVEAFFVQMAQAWARGFMEEDTASLTQRLLELDQSPLYASAIRRDGMLQPNYGPLRGGAVERMPQGINRFARSTVSGPS